MHVAIIGAGPIGLEAAVLLTRSGCSVRVYERGGVASNVRRWGHVRMFSPWGLNVSPWGRALLSDEPPNDALLTGHEFAARYVEPLARSLTGAIREQTEVISIGRHRVLKSSEIGKPSRRDGGFRILIRDHRGEHIESADAVLDCSGAYGNHRWLGAGGIPCPGEMSVLQSVNYVLPDVLGHDRDRFAGRTTLVSGSGYSAATAVAALSELGRIVPNTRCVWLTRRPSELPITPVPNDTLPARAALTTMVNELATQHDETVIWRPNCVVQSVERTATGYRVGISTAGAAIGNEALDVDEIVALVGYRPDVQLYQELQVHQCYATEGPIKLAAALLGETSNDCLAQARPGIETLRNPEPGFFILGAKSYGRDSRFLLKAGIEQVQTVAAELEAQG